MYKKYPLCLLLFFCMTASGCFGQNPSYGLFSDSIWPAIDLDYAKAKEIYVRNRKRYRYDPDHVLRFAKEALSRNDLAFFKQEVVYVIDHGYRFTYNDTLSEKRQNEFLGLIWKNKLNEWLVSETQKRYPEYLKRVPNAIEYAKSQAVWFESYGTVSGYNMQVKTRLLPFVEDCCEHCSHTADSIAQYLWMETELEFVGSIVELCRLNGNRLPTSFDLVGLSGDIELYCIFAMLRNEECLTLVWQAMHVFFEEAYMRGEIGPSFFESLDTNLRKYSGKQFYGTLGPDVPVVDAKVYELWSKRLRQ